MTKSEFITAIETKPQFIKWVQVPRAVRDTNGVQEHYGIAHMSTPDGTVLKDIFFLVSADDTATWKETDVLDQTKTAKEVKLNALRAYLKANFEAFFITRMDLDNNFAEADVYTLSVTDLTPSRVIVYKRGATPITHRKVI